MKLTQFTFKYLRVILAILCGLYPLLFYYSNNYAEINSVVHLSFFILFFIGLPLLVVLLFHFVFFNIKRLKPYANHIVFITVITMLVALTQQAMYLTVKKKILLVVIILSVLLSRIMCKHLKKVAIILGVLCLTTLPKLGATIYDHVKPKDWAKLPDDLENVKLVKTPNIYFIQTDGFVNESTLTNHLYKHNNRLFNWLRANSFKTYRNFRSNYPTSLASNAATFAMKQHKLGDRLFPDLEFPNARDLISGNNPVLELLKKHNYKTHFIVQDEYFQQNRSQNNYDTYNIDLAEIPFFSDNNSVKKDVFQGLKNQIKQNTNEPQFYFLEKLLPHHIHFVPQENQIESERVWYTKRIDSVSHWLQKTIKHIDKNDPNAIVVIQADHGGWVGLTSFQDMFTTKNKALINSTFSSLLAIKWQGLNNNGYDENLKSSVNIFRVLFSALSENKKWLNKLENNSSYNIRIESGKKSVKKVIDNSGHVIID